MYHVEGLERLENKDNNREDDEDDGVGGQVHTTPPGGHAVAHFGTLQPGDQPALEYHHLQHDGKLNRAPPDQPKQDNDLLGNAREPVRQLLRLITRGRGGSRSRPVATDDRLKLKAVAAEGRGARPSWVDSSGVLAVNDPLPRCTYQ
ncbi:hypothetical protein PG990_008352 [Apiospora arundinis]